MRGLTLIEVPYMVGDDRHAASAGPRRLMDSGAEGVLAASGMDVAREVVERAAPFRDSTSASISVNRSLAAAVARAVEAGRIPIVLAGSCDASLGVLAGFDHARCGVIWFDAHGDFNTPESTVTGFFGGMSLAVLAGHCYQKLWQQVGDHRAVAEEAILMLGVRDLDDAERERLERSRIRVIPPPDGESCDGVEAAGDALAEHADGVYVHVDLDALDPAVAPGIVDQPVPGGLSVEDVEKTVLAIGARVPIYAATLATYNPELDPDGRTLRAALRILGALGRAASSSQLPPGARGAGANAKRPPACARSDSGGPGRARRPF